MKKYLLTIILASSISSVAVAEPFNGAYLGAQGGYDTYHVDGNATLTGFTGKTDLGASGQNFGLFAGYGKTYGSLYFGGEIEGSLNNADMKFTDNAGDNVGVKSKNTFGAGLRAGFLPNATTLLYGSLGAVRSKYDGTGQLTGSKSLTGTRFGLGAETTLSTKTTIRFGWSYTDYQDYKYTGGGISAKLSPTENLFRLGLAYNF